MTCSIQVSHETLCLKFCSPFQMTLLLLNQDSHDKMVKRLVPILFTYSLPMYPLRQLSCQTDQPYERRRQGLQTVTHVQGGTSRRRPRVLYVRTKRSGYGRVSPSSTKQLQVPGIGFVVVKLSSHSSSRPFLPMTQPITKHRRVLPSQDPEESGFTVPTVNTDFPRVSIMKLILVKVRRTCLQEINENLDSS